MNEQNVPRAEEVDAAITQAVQILNALPADVDPADIKEMLLTLGRDTGTQDAADLLYSCFVHQSRPLWYVLAPDGTPVPCDDSRALDAQLVGRGAARRIVAKTMVRLRRCWALVEVSTVFLMADHNHFGDGPPVLWETMTFSRHPRFDGLQCRYTSREQAEAGHDLMVNWLRQRRPSPQSSRRLAVYVKRKAEAGSPYRQRKAGRAS